MALLGTEVIAMDGAQAMIDCAMAETSFSKGNVIYSDITKIAPVIEEMQEALGEEILSL